ncbi:hypothetical protein SAMN06296036_10839 [Pseudobacteriovorax antillogorgiicola]|uniref:Uncharacterized protein n=2 Tax=Pseudobacteriovorax antillogorgiicola TaxID=1513793 RepID=A0A1Y6BWU5_9BACT|nr:hypothetical protein EDD56_108207 [Pseudobacteriovorax antillogorgiicola]SMF25119.1 hypothetical protein SAMN06296036_10839 [Pseudobacteriovorax antillogorgiicola]
MSSEATKLDEKSYSLKEFDEIFFLILNDLGVNAIKGAADCTDAIFRLSSNYVDRPAFEALKKFYDLYFSSGDVEISKDSVNQEVNELFEKIQKKISEGGNTDDIEENEDQKKQRLGLAGVQKQLEGLITLNAGIKRQIIPALTSMQFEDAVSQRMDHLLRGWKMINVFLHNTALLDAEPLARELANTCSSVEETQAYYKTVLGEEAPEGQGERSIFLEF